MISVYIETALLPRGVKRSMDAMRLKWPNAVSPPCNPSPKCEEVVAASILRMQQRDDAPDRDLIVEEHRRMQQRMCTACRIVQSRVTGRTSAVLYKPKAPGADSDLEDIDEQFGDKIDLKSEDLHDPTDPKV